MMLEILVILIAMIIMAKKRGRRKFGRYLRGNVDEELALTALASKDVVGAVFDEVVNERTYVSSIKASWSMANFTPIANAGPIVFGVSHSDYTDAEIEEWIESTGQWNEGDLVASREIGKRLIRKIGAFQTQPGGAAADTIVINDGRPITTKLGWILLQGQTLRLWAFNSGSAAVATTVPTVVANGHVNLWPR